MTVPTGTFQTNDVIGIRESLADIVYDISPVDTPFLNSVSRFDVQNTTHEWQTDNLSAASNNAAVDGDDAPQDTSSPTTRLNNNTQISTKDARVSGTSRSVNTAGRADELDYQMLKRGRELRRDMETALLSNKAKNSGGSSTARELAGVPSWINTNTDAASDGSDPTGDGTDTRTNGTQRAFTEDQVKDVMRQIFDSGGSADVIMVGPFNRQILSSFSAGRTNMQRAEDEVLRASFDVYESDFGQLRIIPNRFQRSRDALILQTDMWGVGFLPGRNMATFDIAKTGDSDARQLLSEYTLQANNEAASGGVFDLTTS